VNESVFRAFLLSEKIMYRLAVGLMPYAKHLDAGRFVVKAGVSNHSDHAYSASKFTPKGVAWIAGELAKHGVTHAE
jgi:phage antirepressor YoqD-like protein